MSDMSQWRSGKSRHDENFPVASWLVRARHRPAIHAFYDFMRSADDIADHPKLSAAEKIHLLDTLEAELLGEREASAVALPLRNELTARGLGTRHAQDLLSAFRQDAVKRRYRDWNELIDYCRLSAMPVGRFVLDVHGEAVTTWPASDALCAALQIINHLQDCGDDYRKLDRVYLPADALSAAGAPVDDLAAARASPALRAGLHSLTDRTAVLLRDAEPLPAQVRDLRLSLEIASIQALAERLIGKLAARDPLSDAVHLHKGEFAACAFAGAANGLWRRWRGTPPRLGANTLGPKDSGTSPVRYEP